MKFCMECGHKSPPGAKFCPGCGTSVSLNNKAGVEESTAHDLPDGEIKDVKLPQGCVTISGGEDEQVTVEGVIRGVPEGYQRQNITRPPNKTLRGLTRDNLSQKLSDMNRSDGSQEA